MSSPCNPMMRRSEAGRKTGLELRLSSRFHRGHAGKFEARARLLTKAGGCYIYLASANNDLSRKIPGSFLVPREEESGASCRKNFHLIR